MTKELDLVYMIDDDEIIIFLTSKLLMDEQFCRRLMTFENAESALAKLSASMETGQDIPDAILFDLHMPVMNGWDFIEEVQKLQVNIPAFIFTASINPSDKKRSYEYNKIKGFISKPLTQIKLQKILKLVNDNTSTT
jgi:CheY-like chemotaxis protein